MQTCLPDKPEVWRIASIIGCEPDAVIGKLLRVWSWFDSHTEDGNAEVGLEVIDKIAGAVGFASALESVRWLTSSGSFIGIPNFERHNGKSAKNRLATSERVAKHRATKTGNENVTRNVIPRPIQRGVKERDGNACVYCGREEGSYIPPETSVDARMHIDHVIPFSQGGSDDIDNLACACNVCNLFKSNRNPEECGLPWPEVNGKRLGNKKSVTKTVTREEKRREDISTNVDIVNTRSRKHRLPADFYPNELGVAKAEQAGLSTTAELEKFRDFHNGKGNTMLDWQATWRTWISNAVKFGKGKAHGQQSRFDALAQSASELTGAARSSTRTFEGTAIQVD